MRGEISFAGVQPACIRSNDDQLHTGGVAGFARSNLQVIVKPPDVRVSVITLVPSNDKTSCDVMEAATPAMVTVRAVVMMPPSGQWDAADGLGSCRFVVALVSLEL